MKIIASFDNEHDAQVMLATEGYSEVVKHTEGTVFTNDTNYNYLLLRSWNGLWEIQQPEINDK